MHRTRFALAAAALGAAASVATSSSGSATMHTVLGAKLAGMGETGVVNLQSSAAGERLCWTFTSSASGSPREPRSATRPACRVAKLGSMYEKKGCAMVAKMALDAIEAKPASYRVWVATKNQPGDLRGTLFAGMAHATHM